MMKRALSPAFLVLHFRFLHVAIENSTSSPFYVNRLLLCSFVSPGFRQFGLKSQPAGPDTKSLSGSNSVLFTKLFLAITLTNKLLYEFLILPDFCQFDVKNEPAGFRPDRTGPDAENPSGSNSD